MMQEQMRLIYAELHAVAHNSGESIAAVEARFEKAIGRSRLAMKGSPLKIMTEQVMKELQKQPLRVRTLLIKQSRLSCSVIQFMHLGPRDDMCLQCVPIVLALNIVVFYASAMKMRTEHSVLTAMVLLSDIFISVTIILVTNAVIKSRIYCPDLQLLAEKGKYHPANVSSKVGGMYFLYVAKADLKDPKEADLIVKYAGKADKSLKDRLDDHGHGMVQGTLCDATYCTTATMLLY